MRLRWIPLAAALGMMGLTPIGALAANSTDYLAMREKTALTPLQSTEHLTSQSAALANKTIELEGKVHGMINGDRGVGYLLCVDSGQVVYLHADERDEAMTLGGDVRVLARVNAHGMLGMLSATRADAPNVTRADFATLRVDNPTARTDDPFAGMKNPGIARVTKPVVAKVEKPLTAPPLQAANPNKTVEEQLPELSYNGAASAKTTQDAAVYYDGFSKAERGKLAQCIRHYNTKISDGMVDKIAYHILEKSNKYDVDPWLTFSLVAQESRFNPYAVSHAGAQGLGQLMPGTARTLGVDDPFDIEQNLDGAVRYLSEQLDTFGKHSLALAAYNAGPGNVRKYDGIPPFRETQHYVKVIWKTYCNMKDSGSASRLD